MMSRSSMMNQMAGNRKRGFGAPGATGLPTVRPPVSPVRPDAMVSAPGATGIRPKMLPTMPVRTPVMPMAKPGRMAKGGKVTRGDGACMKGHTKGKMY